ncbi:hypothetical protein N9137_00875 [Pseudomonadales bacterium]|nr:hypothetical protein [Pseudomonadales bacterium]
MNNKQFALECLTLVSKFVISCAMLSAAFELIVSGGMANYLFAMYLLLLLLAVAPTDKE